MKFLKIIIKERERGQVSIFGIIMILAMLSSTIGTISKMHWSLLRMRARSRVYLCHSLMVPATENFVHFIGRTNKILQGLSLIPPTPVMVAKIQVLKKNLQLGQKMSSISFMKKLRQNGHCSWPSITNMALASPYRHFRRNPIDGTLILEKTIWNYQLEAHSSGGWTLKEDFQISLKGSFNLPNQYGAFLKGKIYETIL